jgi:hypothetical protein
MIYPPRAYQSLLFTLISVSIDIFWRVLNSPDELPNNKRSGLVTLSYEVPINDENKPIH